jgi:hypothetical protein
MILLVILALVVFVLIGIKVNTCDSGCYHNGTIKFENELVNDNGK